MISILTALAVVVIVLMVCAYKLGKRASFEGYITSRVTANAKQLALLEEKIAVSNKNMVSLSNIMKALGDKVGEAHNNNLQHFNYQNAINKELFELVYFSSVETAHILEAVDSSMFMVLDGEGARATRKMHFEEVYKEVCDRALDFAEFDKEGK